ncbi:DUF3558 domain-containing protein [Nocardia sp. NPDC058658]|uniref:DUF3558 domain-containing protein n=1 Tax=Nocardia sp. NPDC058658 TaxID=3346580 RepID=UPI00365924B2
MLVGALALAGCGSSGGPVVGSPTSTAASDGIAENVPTGIDPCNIPQDVLTSITPGLRKGTTDDNTSRGKIKWQGCRYIVSDGYTTTMSLTNLTLDMLREKNFPGREDVVDGRTVLTTHQSSDRTGVESCTLNVQMQAGSLEFLVSNPSSRPVTGHLNACEIGMSVAQKVIPLIASGS